MKTIKMLILLASCIGSIFIAGCIHRSKHSHEQKHPTQSIQKIKQDSNKIATENPTLTVWIHGSRLITKFAPQELLFSKPGITHFSEIKKTYLMHKTAVLLEKKDPQRFQTENFYTYGWSGKVSFKERKKAAKDLYNHLKKITETYKQQYGAIPKIQIITHSHGGNVVLNLAKIKEEPCPFIISELILLACPVQEKTKMYIEDPLFERVYSFFSRGDFLQILDPQGLYKHAKKHGRRPLFSKRVFPSHQKLSQTKIRMYGRSILHLEFLLSYFVSRLPALLNAMDEQKKQYASTQEYPILLVNIQRNKLRTKEKPREAFI